VVHDAASHCVVQLRAGHPLPDVAVLRRRCAEALNRTWRASREQRQAFWHRPRGVPMLEEALYGVGPSRVALHQAREKLERVLVALMGLTPLWCMVREAAAGDVRIVGRYNRFDLALAPNPLGAAAGRKSPRASLITCYAAPDLIVRPSASQPTRIVDFKCGRGDAVIDQILTYGLAVQEGLRLDSPAGWMGAVAALDEAGDAASYPWSEFTIAPEDLADARSRITCSVGAMRALLRLSDPKAQELFLPLVRPLLWTLTEMILPVDKKHRQALLDVHRGGGASP
jgi:hypothetical protein